MSITHGSPKKWGTEMPVKCMRCESTNVRLVCRTCEAKEKKKMGAPLSVMDFADILKSLDHAMKQAHGTAMFSDLEKMSAIELLKLLAPNHIIFMYVGEEKRK